MPEILQTLFFRTRCSLVISVVAAKIWHLYVQFLLGHPVFSLGYRLWGRASGRDSRVVSISDLNAEGRGSNSGEAQQEFSDGICKTMHESVH